MILEVVGISALTMAFGATLYMVERRLKLIDPTELLWLEILVTLLITYLITSVY